MWLSRAVHPRPQQNGDRDHYEERFSSPNKINKVSDGSTSSGKSDKSQYHTLDHHP
jgi:hypothetical protein